MSDDQTTSTDAVRCRALRRDGAQCQGNAGASGYCFAHDPALAGRRQTGNRQGGRNKATAARVTKLVPSRLKPMLDRLFTALEETHDGTLEPRQASAMASLAGAILKAYETVELDGRLRALEGSNTDDRTG